MRLEEDVGRKGREDDGEEASLELKLKTVKGKNVGPEKAMDITDEVPIRRKREHT